MRQMDGHDDRESTDSSESSKRIFTKGKPSVRPEIALIDKEDFFLDASFKKKKIA